MKENGSMIVTTFPVQKYITRDMLIDKHVSRIDVAIIFFYNCNLIQTALELLRIGKIEMKKRTELRI